MKKMIAGILAALCVASAGAANAADTVTIRVDGEELALEEPAFLENDRTLVPLRGVFEAVGAQVMWDQDSKTVVVTQNQEDALTVIVVQIDSKNAFVGEEQKVLDVPATLVNDTTYVPLRFILEELGNSVTWDQETKTVDITTA